MKILVAGALLCVLSAPVLAQDTPDSDAPTQAQSASGIGGTGKDAPEIGAGELRLDGKIKGLLVPGQWQMQAISWTSPRAVLTTFADPRTKTIVFGDEVYIHPLNKTDKFAVKDVKLGTRVAIIGTNLPDGSLQAREVILLEGYGERKSIGTLRSNRITSQLVGQSRKARDEGNLPRALALIESAIGAAQGAHDSSGEGLATQDKTLLLFELNQPAQAAQSAARVEALGRSINNPLLISMGITSQARVLAASGQLDRAIQMLEGADSVSASSEPEIHLSVLSSLAGAYGQASRTQNLVATLQRILPLEESLHQRDDATETLLSLAQELAPTDKTKARDYLKQAEPRISEAADEKKRANLRAEAGTAKFALGDKAAANTDFEAAAKLYESVGDAKSAATTRALPAKLEAESKKVAQPQAAPPPAAPDNAAATDNGTDDAGDN